MSKKLTLKEIKERCNLVHDDKYIIPEQDYIDMYTLINVICNIHGEFKITPKDLLRSGGCSNCYIRYIPKTYSIDELRKKCFNIHGGKYYISEQNHINAKTHINVFCNTHKKLFSITSDNLLRGKGCPVCGGKQKLTINNIQEKCDIIHKGKGYIIPKQEYIKNDVKINVICPISNHGGWKVQPKNLLSGYGCPTCNSSKGEIKIETLLNENNIVFKNQKKFKDCKHIKELPFDFYLPEYNICIEFDGEQHFKPIKRFGGQDNFAKVKLRDNIKNEYCKNNGIKLIRIKYNENIEDKLKDLLNK